LVSEGHRSAGKVVDARWKALELDTASGSSVWQVRVEGSKLQRQLSVVRLE